jgi:hypothetical protein
MSAEVGARSGWGDYRDYIGDALACCVDYVGRLQRSFDGEIAPDRHYFLEKAEELQYWATNLVARCEEIQKFIEANREAEGSSDVGE